MTKDQFLKEMVIVFKICGENAVFGPLYRSGIHLDLPGYPNNASTGHIAFANFDDGIYVLSEKGFEKISKKLIELIIRELEKLLSFVKGNATYLVEQTRKQWVSEVKQTIIQLQSILERDKSK